MLCGVIDGGLQIGQHAGSGQGFNRCFQGHAGLHVFWGVAQRHAGFGAVKSGGRNGQIALRGIAIGDFLDVGIDAKNLLHNHNAALGCALGLRHIGCGLHAVGGGEMDGAHGCFLDSLKELIHILSDKLLWVCPLRDTFTKSHRRLIVTSRILLVTGGSRGIGAATCLLAAQQGWQVAVNYTHNAQAAQEVVAHIKSAGGQALAIQADVADEAQVLRMYETIDQQMGRITGLVNNAGVVDVTARLEDMSVARLKRMFDVNVIGSMVVAREAVRRMSTKHGGAGGSIVNLSSAAARLGSPNMYLDYASAKGAIDVFTIGLAKEVAAEGIRVNAVRPGLIETEIHASGGLPNRVKELQHLVPMQRGGSAMEVAQSIVWLLSDAASYTTMSLLDVSGGR